MRDEALIRCRRAWKLSQRDLAHVLGLHPMTISKTERGLGSLPDRCAAWIAALEGRRPPCYHWRYELQLVNREPPDPTRWWAWALAHPLL